MLPKISYVFNRKNNNKVEICIYLDGKRRYLSTGVALPNGAKFRNGTISGCATAPALNKTLNTAMALLQGQLQEQIENDSFDLQAFSLAVTHNKGNFYEWALDHISKSRLRESTVYLRKMALNKFKKHGIVEFTDITPQRINKALSAMIDDGMNPTSVRTYLGSLRSLISAARKQQLITKDPFQDVAPPKGKSAEISYLTREELEAVENADLTGKKSDVRDMFLFACYTGLAYSDLTKIEKKDIVTIDGKKYIIDKRKKTGGRYKLRLLPKALEILERHNYNLNLVNNIYANRLLAKIEEQLGLRKHLSMHVGRHTFATLALSSGVRIETVSRMLAHADITTTQIYAKVLQKDVDEGFDILENKL